MHNVHVIFFFNADYWPFCAILNVFSVPLCVWWTCCVLCLCWLIVCLISLCTICSFSTLILSVGLLTCKNRLPYDLYCVDGNVKHCSIQSNRVCGGNCFFGTLSWSVSRFVFN